MRPAAQGRVWPRAIAALRDRGSGARARAVRPAAQGRSLAPRAIAALQDRGSRARARAVSDQLRKVTHWRPERLLPCGIAVRVPGKKGRLLRNAAEAPERLLPYGIAARVPGKKGQLLRRIAQGSKRAL
ncbi:hypothetical protein BSK61_16645 [Paenibacillus odorifer]|nr:hypothetical protein BSK61_16645 [Paenibacillus odorifer]